MEGVCKGHDVSQDARCGALTSKKPCEEEGVSPFSDGNCDWVVLEVVETPSPTPSPPASCSGEGTLMPGEDCSPWMGAKCCTDGGHDCVYVNASEFLCLPCDHNDMHTVGFGDADGHCSQNDYCSYDSETSKCMDGVCKGHDVSQDARCG